MSKSLSLQSPTKIISNDKILNNRIPLNNKNKLEQ